MAAGLQAVRRGALNAVEGTSITPLPDGRCELALSGNFLPDWTGTFCEHLGLRGIHVDSGFARQVVRGQWESRFVLRAQDPAVDLSSQNYRAFAMAPKRWGVPGQARIEGFEIDDRGDALAVTLRAPAALGFLGQVLATFSRLMLFVHEMRIEAARDQSHDHFVLKGLAGLAPAGDTRARLEAVLAAMRDG